MSRVAVALWLVLAVGSVPVIRCTSPHSALDTNHDSPLPAQSAGDAILRSTRVQLDLDSDNMGNFTDEHPDAAPATVYKYTDPQELMLGQSADTDHNLESSLHKFTGLNDLVIGDNGEVQYDSSDPQYSEVGVHNNERFDQLDSVADDVQSDPKIETNEESGQVENQEEKQSPVNGLQSVRDMLENENVLEDAAGSDGGAPVDQPPETNGFSQMFGEESSAGTTHDWEGLDYEPHSSDSSGVPESVSNDQAFVAGGGGKWAKMMPGDEGENSVTSESEEKEKFLVELARRILDVRKQGFSKTSFIIHPNNAPLPAYEPLSHHFRKEGSENNLKKIDSDDRENNFHFSHNSSGNATKSDSENDSDSVTQNLPEISSLSDNSESTEVTPTEGFPSSSVGISPYTSLYEKLQPSPEDEPLVSSLVSQLKEILNSTEAASRTEVEPSSTTAHHSISTDVESTENPDKTSTDTEATDPPKMSEIASENPGTMEGEVTDFLQSVASSSGFQGAFVGELIKSFSSLNHNAMSLLYNLLIGPLKLAPTVMNLATDKSKEDDLKALRNISKGTFEPSEPVSNSVNSEGLPSEDMWLPFKSRARTSRNGYAIEVITAPTRKKFELVVGSSLSSEPRDGAMFQRRSGLPEVGNLQMGMSMPPPEALGALPPGAQIILPSQLRRKPVLPKITIGPDNIPVPVIETRPPRRQEPQANPLDVFSSLPNFFSSLFSSPTEEPQRPNKRPGPPRRRRLPSHPYHGVKNRPHPNRQLPGRKQSGHTEFDEPLNLQPPGIPLVHKMVHPRPPGATNPNLLHQPIRNPPYQPELPPFPPRNVGAETLHSPGDTHNFGQPQDRSHFEQFVPSPEYKPDNRETLSEVQTPQLSAENAIGFFPKPRPEGGFVPLSQSREEAVRRTEADQFGISSHFAVRHEMSDRPIIDRRTFSVRDPYGDNDGPGGNENHQYSLGSEQDFGPIYQVSRAPDRNYNRIVPQKVTFKATQTSDYDVSSHDNNDNLRHNASPSMYQHFSLSTYENSEKTNREPTMLNNPDKNSAYSTAGKSNSPDRGHYPNSQGDYQYDSVTSEHRFDDEHSLHNSPDPKPFYNRGTIRKPIDYQEEVHNPAANASAASRDHVDNWKPAAAVDDTAHFERDFETSQNLQSNRGRPGSNVPAQNREYYELNNRDNSETSVDETSVIDAAGFNDMKHKKPSDDAASYDGNFYEYYEHNPDELLYADFSSKRIKSDESENERRTPHESYGDGITQTDDINSYEYDSIPQASHSHVEVVSTAPAKTKEIDDYPPEYYDYVYYDDANDRTIGDSRPEKEIITFGSFNSSQIDYETDGFVVKDVVPMVGTVRPINQSSMFNHNMAKSQEEDIVHNFPSLETPIKPVDALNNIQLSQMFEDDAQSIQAPVSDMELSRAPGPNVRHHRPIEEDPDSSAAYLFNTIDLVPQSADLFNTRQTVDQNIEDNPVLHNSSAKFNLTYSETTNIIVGEDVPAQEYMAYVLIGSCIGLSLLSISGVLLIVKFKKSCGSRQIRSRQRLKKSSLPDVSHVQETFLERDTGGHKLGSWFTGRGGGTFGSSKLRSNMALPSVDDLRRDTPERSSSRRDLLSSASDASEGSERGKSQDEPIASRSKSNSWSSKEKEASQNDASQSSPALEVVSESAKRQSFERDGRDNSRKEHECKHQRSHSSQSSEFQKKHLPEAYTTDSEFYDPTSADEGRSSRFMETSHDFDTISNMRGRKSVTTSQELGEKLSRDIRNFHERASPVTSRDSTVDRTRRNPDGEGHLRRTTSEVSFTRDNVQNEVFLEFDNIFKQHGQYLTPSDGHQSSLDRASEAGATAADKRSNSPDSIENPKTPERRAPGSGGVSAKRGGEGGKHHRSKSTSVSSGKLPRKSSPPTPPRFTPPPPPPRPPKPERLSKSFGQDSSDAGHPPPPKSDRLV